MPLPERDETIETVEYSDGFGRLLQTRTQAEDVLFGDPSFGGGVLPADQSVATGDAVGRRRAAGDPPNVIVSGWQVYDNKGRVVEKYEPFFAVGWDYAPPGDAQFGQKATMFYDPRGQVIRTLNPDGSEQRVIYGIPADLTNPDAVRAHALGSLHLRRQRSGAAESRRRTARRSPMPHRRPIISRHRAS